MAKHKLTYLGHATWRLTTADGKVIIFDPFLTPNPLTPEGEKRQTRCDVMALTHGHIDHTSDALQVYRETGCKVVAIIELCAIMQKNGVKEEDLISANTGGTVEVEGVRFTLVPAWHSSSTQFGENMEYAGSPNGFVVELPDGLTLYNSGDTWIFEEMKYIKRLWNPTIGLLCIGGHFTMDAKTAALAARELLELKTVICQHYGTFPVLTDTPDDLRRELEGSGIEVLAPAPGETIEIGE